MSLSGAHNSGGSVGGSYIRISWSASQDWGANTSTINATLQLILQGGTSIVATESGDINIDGVSYGYSRGSTSRGPNGTHTLHTASRVLGHNADGTRSFSIGGSFNSGWSSFGSLGTGMGGYALDTIPRYANINSWSVGSPTEQRLTVSVQTDRAVDIIDYQVNGGAWTRGYTGSTANTSFNIGGLLPATTYSVKVRVRNQASGLYTESGVKSATTTAVTITSFTLPTITDTTMNLAVSASHVMDLLQYKEASSSTWIDGFVGDFSSKTITVPGLTPNQSYTWQVRARHKDTGAYTPTVSATGTTQFPQPLQPSNLSPASGAGVGTLTPLLDWQYNSSSPDSQTAYQVLIKRQSDGVTVYDSGKVASTNTQMTVPGSTLLWNVNYSWQVRTWSGTDIQGPYSDLVLFKTSQPPTVTITVPTAGAVVISDSPTINWTYSDPESTAQTSFRVVVKEIQNTGETDGETIFNRLESNSAATTYTLPINTLTNGKRYIVQVTATDTDGVSGTSAIREFTVAFISPAQPDISVDLSEDILFAQINVNSNTPANDSYDAEFMRVYRRQQGSNDWKFIGQLEAFAQFIDTYDDNTGWSFTAPATGMDISPVSRQGTYSLSLIKSGTGTAVYAKTIPSVSILGYEKIRLWVYTANVTGITALTVKLGTNSSNYFSFSIPVAQLAADRWTSVEVAVNALSVTGSPTLGNITYERLELTGSSAKTTGQVLVDGLRLVPVDEGIFLYDYELQNGVTYEYAATAYNASESLESEKTISSPVAIEYPDLLNTYLVPVENKTGGLVGFMDAKSTPNWSAVTQTAYHEPVGAQYPTVYSLGRQRYRKGQAQIRFFDSKFGGNGLTAVHRFEEIMNEKPIMLRTWWGDIFYVSIDGQLNVQRLKGVGWTVDFNFTEIGNGE